MEGPLSSWHHLEKENIAVCPQGFLRSWGSGFGLVGRIAWGCRGTGKGAWAPSAVPSPQPPPWGCHSHSWPGVSCGSVPFRSWQEKKCQSRLGMSSISGLECSCGFKDLHGQQNNTLVPSDATGSRAISFLDGLSSPGLKSPFVRPGCWGKEPITGVSVSRAEQTGGA